MYKKFLDFNNSATRYFKGFNYIDYNGHFYIKKNFSTKNRPY